MEVPRWVWDEGEWGGQRCAKGTRQLVPALPDESESHLMLSHLSPCYLYVDLYLQ